MDKPQVWGVFVKHGEDLSEMYSPHAMWELEAQHVTDPRTGDGRPGEDVDFYRVTLAEDDIAGHESAYIAMTEAKLDNDRAVVFWQDYVE